MSMMSIRRVCQKLLAPVIIFLVLGLTIGMFYIGVPQLGKEPTSYQGPSVKINGQVLKDDEFNDYLMRAAQQSSQMQQYGMTVTEPQVRDTALTLAIQDIAFNQEMKKAKIKVDNAEVDKVIKKYFPTEEELQSFLQQRGFANKNDFRKALKNDLEKQKFIAQKARELKVKVTKAQVDGMLEQIEVNHILVGLKTSDNKTRTDAEALARANEVYAKVTADSAKFAELAKQYSDDPGSKDKSGSLGQMPLEQFKTGMVKEFVDGTMALKNGEISKPVKTQYGYHIIQLVSRQKPTGKDYEEKYKETANDLLVQQAPYDQAFQAWLQKVYKKAESNMEILDPALRAFRLNQEQKWAEAGKAYEKAASKAYYKNRIDIYVDGADALVKAKQAKDAITLLKKLPAPSQDVIDYQIALAKAYFGDGQKATAKQILTKFGAAHPNEASIHERLKATYTEFKMTAEASKEDSILATLAKKDQEMLQKYQQDLSQKGSGVQENQTAPVENSNGTTTSK